MTKNKLSHTQLKMFTECGRKYKFWYVDKLRPKIIHGALLFGSSIDHALNHLLKTKNLEESLALFEKSFRFQPINNESQYLPESTNIAYSLKDFDYELLISDDISMYTDLKKKLDLGEKDTILQDYEYLTEKKKNDGLDSLEFFEKKLLNMANWLSLRAKGRIMLNSYCTDILPKIKEVLTIQKRNTITNNEGDEITLYLDFIVEMQDGKRYLLDNKTSSIEYDQDSPMKSQQLILYYHSEKDEYNLDGVGFVVMYKQILKNRKKICSVCNKNGTGQRHKTCDAEINGKRCNAEWNESIDPKCNIDIILNHVPEAAENLVIETFDEANEGIKKEAFGPNLGACGNENFRCAFYNKCWKGTDKDLVQVGEKK